MKYNINVGISFKSYMDWTQNTDICDNKVLLKQYNNHPWQKQPP